MTIINPTSVIRERIANAICIKSNELREFLKEQILYGIVDISTVLPIFVEGIDDAYQLIVAKKTLECLVSELHISVGNIYGFIDSTDNSFFVMWDHAGLFSFDVAQILFDTDVIPVNLNCNFTKEELKKTITFLKFLFPCEQKAIKNIYKKPLLLANHEPLIDRNSYSAYSLNERKWLLVHNYKPYCKDYILEPYFNDVNFSSEEYEILSFSAELISAIGLNLHFQIAPTLDNL